MTARTLSFFETYDLLLTPTTIAPAFPVENRYLAECAGHKFENYVEWLAIALLGVRGTTPIDPR
jgi:amidase